MMVDSAATDSLPMPSHCASVEALTNKSLKEPKKQSIPATNSHFDSRMKIQQVKEVVGDAISIASTQNLSCENAGLINGDIQEKLIRKLKKGISDILESVLDQHNKTVSRMQAEINQLKNSNAELFSEHESLIGEMQAVVSDDFALERNYVALKNEAMTLMQERDRLKDMLDVKEGELIITLKLKHQGQAQFHQMLKDAAAERTELEETVNKLITDKCEMQDELERMAREKVEIIGSVNDLREYVGTCASLRADKAELENRLQNLITEQHNEEDAKMEAKTDLTSDSQKYTNPIIRSEIDKNNRRSLTMIRCRSENSIRCNDQEHFRMPPSQHDPIPSQIVCASSIEPKAISFRNKSELCLSVQKETSVRNVMTKLKNVWQSDKCLHDTKLIP